MKKVLEFLLLSSLGIAFSSAVYSYRDRDVTDTAGASPALTAQTEDPPDPPDSPEPPDPPDPPNRELKTM